MRKDGRPDQIEDALVEMHTGQWFRWKDHTNKIYSNLELNPKMGVNGELVDNPNSLPTESTVNAKLKEIQDSWDAANGG